MQRFFICYRRDDSKSVSSRIYDRLATVFGKQNVFKDVNVIPAGVDFREFLKNEIAKTDVVLVIIGTRWQTLIKQRASDPRDYVRIEIENALFQDKWVIPVLVEGANMPDEDALPESIVKLAYINSARIDDDPDFHDDMDRLIAMLQEIDGPRRRRPNRRVVGLTMAFTILVVLALMVLVFLQSNPIGVTPNALTLTVSALPPVSADNPQLSSFGGMRLLTEPKEDALTIANVAGPLPVIGRDTTNEYFLVKTDNRYGWIRFNNFMQLSDESNTIPVISYQAPTPTPGGNATSTPRPTPTIRPTSEFAAGWLVNASSNFVGTVPDGWSASTTDFMASAPNEPLELIGRANSDDILRRTGYFANSGTRSLFSVTGDEAGFFMARLFFMQGITGADGFRYFGIEPVEGTAWRLVTASDTRDITVLREFLLLPDRVYDLTMLLEGNNTFMVTLMDQETGQRIIDGERFTTAIWSAKVGDPIFFALNPTAGSISLQRVDTLLKSQ
jgi:hypothetical protein